MLRRLVKLATVLALLVAILSIPAAWLIDRFAGKDLIAIRPLDEAAVAANRATWDISGDDASVVDLYGSTFPGEQRLRYVFVPEDRVIHPQERPSLSLFAKGDGENPLQAKTVWYVATVAAIAAGGVAVLLLLLSLLLARPRRPGITPG